MNVGIITNDPLDWGSFYRAWGPLSLLSRTHGIRLIESQSWFWKTLLQCDVVFMFKCWGSVHRNIAELCAVTGTPLWVDYDDHLLALPESNPYFDELSKSRGNIERICALANVLTVSTSALQSVYGKTATVMPNAFNGQIFDQHIWRFHEDARAKVISWRGAAAHDADLALVLPAIERVAKGFADWSWHFFGYAHWEVDRVIPRGRCVRHPFDPDLFGYMRNFGETRPSIHIVPLEDTPFNRCKSNIAWIEATFAGAVVLAPNWEEWQKPGIHNYRDVGDFEAKLRELIQASDDERRQDVARSRKFIAENLTLCRTNEIRAEVLGVIKANASRQGALA